MSNDTLIITNTELLTEAADDSSLVSHDVELTSVYIDNVETVVDKAEELTLLEVGIQGPPGAIGDAGGAFLVVNRLNEIAADEAAKVQVRSNLDLQNT